MNDIFQNLLIVVGTIASMEVFANLMHRYVMHGFGWGWHRSHHEPRTGVWEKNDLYAIVFAAISIALFALDDMHFGAPFWIALGMTLYGVLYAILHDALVHRRFTVPFLKALVQRSRYLERLIQAHRIHHAVNVREGAVSFGFLYAAQPAELAQTLRQRRAAKTSQ
jgi:beta-carotene 3-hydroxylase